MIINVIHLDPDQPIDQYANPQLKEQIRQFRIENALSIARQSKEHGFAVRFWPGVTGNDVFRCENISKAFKQVVMYAKEESLPMVTIGEEDLQFTAPGAWDYYLKNIPEDFHIFSGGIYAGQLQENRIINGYSGHTLITVNETFYDFFLSANESDHLDRFLGNFCFEKKYYVCLPFVVKQNPNYSENHRRKMTYEMYEKGWDYYSG